MVRPEVATELRLVALDLGDRYAVCVAAGSGIDDDDLLFDRHGLVDALLEQLGEPVAAVELAWDTGRARSRRSRRPRARGTARGRSSAFPTTSFIALIWAAPPTRLTEFPTLIAGRTPE
jgi:chloramphenicol 3-O-phosphotransferase